MKGSELLENPTENNAELGFTSTDNLLAPTEISL